MAGQVRCVPCDSCGANLLRNLEENERRKVVVIFWASGLRSYFCDKECQLDWMVANNATYSNPNPQPDVNGEPPVA